MSPGATAPSPENHILPRRKSSRPGRVGAPEADDEDAVLDGEGPCQSCRVLLRCDVVRLEKLRSMVQEGGLDPLMTVSRRVRLEDLATAHRKFGQGEDGNARDIGTRAAFGFSGAGRPRLDKVLA